MSEQSKKPLNQDVQPLSSGCALAAWGLSFGVDRQEKS